MYISNINIDLENTAVHSSGHKISFDVPALIIGSIVNTCPTYMIP